MSWSIHCTKCLKLALVTMKCASIRVIASNSYYGSENINHLLWDVNKEVVSSVTHFVTRTESSYTFGYIGQQPSCAPHLYAIGLCECYS